MIARDEVVELKIDLLAFEGKAIARLDGYVVFVTGAVPGDVVRARITKSKRDYAEAKVVEILSASPSRVTPRCDYFGVCGGCKWQHLEYTQQLKYKRLHVVDALERTGGLKIDVADTVGAEDTYEYRNKLEFTFSDRPFRIKEIDTTQAALGFHAPGRFDKVIDIDHCHLADGKINEILNWFKKTIDPNSDYVSEMGLSIYNSNAHSGLLRFLTIRKSFATNEYMVSLIVLEKDDRVERIASDLRRDLAFVSTFASIVNPTRAQVASGDFCKVHFGSGFITEKIGGYSFRISPLSFFQTNSVQAERLYDVTKEEIGKKCGTIFDLYSGTGSISIFLSSLADRIIGFELVESAVKDAAQNAALNRVGNVSFVRTDLLDLFKGRNPLENFEQMNLPRPDVIVLDPPRSGLHPKISSNLHLLSAERIVYVSCNPMTQARDLKDIVSHGYRALHARPVDMFPHTYHIENIVTLEKT